LREGAKVEESRQTRRQTRSGRRSTRTAVLENAVKRNGDQTDKGVELLKHEKKGERERERGKKRERADKMEEIYFVLKLNSLRTIKNYISRYEF